MKDTLRKATRDPERWAWSDMTRDEWLIRARTYGYYLILAAGVTLFAIGVGLGLRA